ncbi:hypothetical protein [Ethanoligenens sp.]
MFDFFTARQQRTSSAAGTDAPTNTLCAPVTICTGSGPPAST